MAVTHVQKFRRSRPEVFSKKVALKIFFSAYSTKTVFYKNRWSSQKGCSTKQLFLSCSKNCLFLYYGSSRPEAFSKKGVLKKIANVKTPMLEALLLELQGYHRVPDYKHSCLLVILRNF